MKRPLAVVCLMFAAGVWMAEMYASASLWLVFLCAGLFTAAAAVLVIFKIKCINTAVPVAVTALLFGVIWSWGTYQIWTRPALEHIGEQLDAEMLVNDYPSESQYGWLVPVKLFNVQTALFTVDKPDVRPGDTIAAPVNIGEYSRGGYVIKAVQAGTPRIKKADQVPLTMYPVRMRHDLVARLKLLFTRNPDFAAALVTGERSGFSEAFKNALAVSGLSHTVSISGLHISFITGIFIWLFGGMRRAAPFAIPFIILFTAVVGFPPSAVRAAVMNILLLVSLILKRDYDARVSLAAALALILFVQPGAALDVGLQLSFASTFGIISFAGLWSAFIFERVPALRKRYCAWIVSSLSTTASALIFTVPLTACYFGTVSLAAPISNLLALPLISLLFFGSLIAAGASYAIEPISKMLSLCLDYGFELVKWLVNTISGFSFSALYVSETMTVILLVFQYVMLALCYLGWRRGSFRPVFPLCLSACSLCAVILTTALYYDYSNTFRVTAVDVGQGQSLILSSKSRTVVIDCGGKNAGTEAMKTLLSRGAASIEALVLTHCHSDHANGVETLLERVKVGAIVTFEITDELARVAEQFNTPVLIAESDMEMQAGDFKLELLVPRGDSDENERCMSVLASYNDFTMLVTGDMNADSERRLLRFARIPELSLYIAGHHGSKYSTSETLLYYTKPKAAIISVGANSYGHPAAETLSRLEEYGTSVYRTDIHGTITVTAGG